MYLSTPQWPLWSKCYRVITMFPTIYGIDWNRDERYNMGTTCEVFGLDVP